MSRGMREGGQLVEFDGIGADQRRPGGRGWV